jgi:hypothetical protein
MYLFQIIFVQLVSNLPTSLDRFMKIMIFFENCFSPPQSYSTVIRRFLRCPPRTAAPALAISRAVGCATSSSSSSERANWLKHDDLQKRAGLPELLAFLAVRG